MDPRERADRALARARARGTFVVTPDDAISPMDAASTLQIPRSVIAAADCDDTADNTMVIARDEITQVYEQTQQYPAYQEATRPVDGLVPTMQQPSPQRSLLSRRLDGN